MSNKKWVRLARVLEGILGDGWNKLIDPPQNDRSIRLKMTAESGSK